MPVPDTPMAKPPVNDHTPLVTVSVAVPALLLMPLPSSNAALCSSARPPISSGIFDIPRLGVGCGNTFGRPEARHFWHMLPAWEPARYLGAPFSASFVAFRISARRR
jgi:hypothetical protein